MSWTPKPSLTAMALAGLLTLPLVARADLGPLQVVSDIDGRFTALIPFVGTPPDNNVLVSLADRNLYPMLAPYSESANLLTILLRRNLDGTPSGIVIVGPDKFSEPTLRFAISEQWATGGAVREYQVDAHFALPPQHDPAAPPRDNTDKKPLSLVHAYPTWSDLGLGGLAVKSLPGEPLLAESEVFGHGLNAHHRLYVRILPGARKDTDNPEQMRQLLASMHHKLVRAPSGSHVLQLTSDLPVSVPMLGFRLELSLGDARMVRRYELTVQNGTFQVSEQTVSGRASAFKVLRVLPGDSLSVIARRMRHPGLSLADVMRRLYQENPQAFIAGDINKLLAGAQLKYPETWATHADLSRSAQIPAPAVQVKAAQPSVSPSQAAALRARLHEQDALLERTQQLSHALENKLRVLQTGAAKPAPVPTPTPASRLNLPVTPLMIESAGAVAAAAAAAVLLLARRRRLRLNHGGPPGDPETRPTIEGMRQWLRYDPTRHDLRYRLLQLLAIEDHPQAFIEEAEKARALFGEDSPMWLGVVEMGRSLAPDYPWSAAPKPEASPAAAVREETSAMPPAQPHDAALETLALPEADTPPVAHVLAAAPAPLAMEAYPERPLIEEGEWDAFAPAEIAFREPDPLPVVEFEPLHEPDKNELAKLYLEMGDAQAAQELMQEPGDTSKSSPPSDLETSPSLSVDPNRPYRPRFF